MCKVGQIDKWPKCRRSNRLVYFIFIQKESTFCKTEKLKHSFSYFPNTALNNYTTEICAKQVATKSDFGGFSLSGALAN